MPSQIEKLLNEPIVVVHLSSDYDVKTELPQSVPEYLKLLNTLADPVFWIVDLSAVVLDMEGIIFGANMLARSENPLYHHPNVCQVIYVTTNPTLRAAVEGMTSRLFGRVAITAVNTLDEALMLARAN